MFHPFELAVCGHSGSGKTTLVERLIARLAPALRVGYAKHSSHDFDIDRPGKDTARARAAGAARVFLTNDRATAMTTAAEMDFVQCRTAFDDCDCVLAEGWKTSPLPRIVMVDAAGRMLRQGNGSRDARPPDVRSDGGRASREPPDPPPVLAVVGAAAQRPADVPGSAPYFHRDDLDGLAAFVTRHFASRVERTPLHGLILAGGRSTRMQRDKATLEYAGRAQLARVYDLVAARCPATFVSARPGQWADGRFADLPQLPDTILDCGPTGGILSAMRAHPDAAWLVTACDLPFLDGATLDNLLGARDPHKVATAYVSSSDGLPEPLCAVYEPRARSRLYQFLAIGYSCPRKMLINSHAKRLPLANPGALDNVNHPEEYARAQRELRGQA